MRKSARLTIVIALALLVAPTARRRPRRSGWSSSRAPRSPTGRARPRSPPGIAGSGLRPGRPASATSGASPTRRCSTASRYRRPRLRRPRSATSPRQGRPRGAGDPARRPHRGVQPGDELRAHHDRRRHRPEPARLSPGAVSTSPSSIPGSTTTTPTSAAASGPAAASRTATTSSATTYDEEESDPQWQPVPHPDSVPDDCQAHGTHVAGILGANGAIRGVAPDVTFGAYKRLRLRRGDVLGRDARGDGARVPRRRRRAQHEHRRVPSRLAPVAGGTGRVAPGAQWDRGRRRGGERPPARPARDGRAGRRQERRHGHVGRQPRQLPPRLRDHAGQPAGPVLAGLRPAAGPARHVRARAHRDAHHARRRVRAAAGRQPGRQGRARAPRRLPGRRQGDQRGRGRRDRGRRLQRRRSGVRLTGGAGRPHPARLHRSGRRRADRRAPRRGAGQSDLGHRGGAEQHRRTAVDVRVRGPRGGSDAQARRRRSGRVHPLHVAGRARQLSGGERNVDGVAARRRCGRAVSAGAPARAGARRRRGVAEHRRPRRGGNRRP